MKMIYDLLHLLFVLILNNITVEIGNYEYYG